MSRRAALTGRGLAVAAVALAAAAGLRWGRHAVRSPLATAPELAAGSSATLLVVLRPSDCESHDRLLAEWARLEDGGRVRVTAAVLDGPGSPAARDSLERRLGLPLLFDVAEAAEVLALRLGYDATPVSVLLDRAGRPRAVVPPTSDADAARAAARVVEEQLALLGRPGRER